MHGRNGFHANILQRAMLDCVLAGKSFAATCGVGAGKTRGILECAHMLGVMRPGLNTLVMSDTGVHLHTFMQPMAEEVLPGYGWIWMADPRKNYWQAPSGHKAWFRAYLTKSHESAQKSNTQGINATACLLDECQDIQPQVKRLLATRNRIPGPRGEKPFYGLSGLPVYGAWQMRFARDNGWQELRAGSAVNAHNFAEGYIETMRRNLPPDEYKALVLGLPQPPGGLVMRSWSTDEWSPLPFTGGNILSGWTYDPSMRTRLAIDFGRQFPAVLFIAHDAQRGVDVIFDQICPDCRTDEDELVALILRKAWPRKFERMKPDGVSVLLDAASGDPMGTVAVNDRKGIDAITQMMLPPTRGGIGLFVSHTFDHVKRHIPNGVRRVNRRTLDNYGRCGLVACADFWARDLEAQHGRGFAQMATRLVYKDGSNEIPKGERAEELDHIHDCLRYDSVNWCWDDTTVMDGRGMSKLHEGIPKPRVADLRGVRASAIRSGGH